MGIGPRRHPDDKFDPDWPPIDLDRLRPEERELWDEYFSEIPDPGLNEGPGFSIWEFGCACEFLLWGFPDVVKEYLDRGDNDPSARIAEYMRNVREAKSKDR